MRAQRRALLCLTVALIVASADLALAQKSISSGPSSSIGVSRPPASPPRGGGDGGYHGGGGRGPGWGGVATGVILGLPAMVPPAGATFIDDGSADDGAPRRRASQRAARRGPSGAPPAGERRLVPDEVVIEVANSVSQQQIDALQRRHRLTRIESQRFALTGTTMFRWRIPDRRSVPAVIRALEADRVVASAQPNYLYALQEDAANPDTASEGDAAQYELAKLHLPQAHTLAKGDGITIAVIDSGIDAMHPELAGSVAGALDVVPPSAPLNKHGTAIAGLIAAHGKLMGAAPNARILNVRTFGAAGTGNTFDILRALDWAAASGARIFNMSFAGPADPVTQRSLEAASKKGIVLVAAAGNAGETSPPLYPAAYPDVIAVSGTDADDKIFVPSNRGRHIAIAAPGADIFVAIPDGGYEVSSGTSYSAAEVSGIIALMLERKPNLTPEGARGILAATAKDIGPKGRDVLFGAGLADAFGALMAEGAPLAAAPAKGRVERISTGAR
jgi:subtilisin family serine protease